MEVNKEIADLQTRLHAEEMPIAKRTYKKRKAKRIGKVKIKTKIKAVHKVKAKRTKKRARWSPERWARFHARKEGVNDTEGNRLTLAEETLE